MAAISASALLLLLETDPTPHILLDARAEGAGPLPFEVPETAVLARVSGPLPELLRSEFPENDPKRFRDTHIVVVVTEGGTPDEVAGAVESLKGAGFGKIAVLAGGVSSFNAAQPNPEPPRYISRNALAVLLRDQKCTLLDVRRADERAKFGSIDTSGPWIPVDELPGASNDQASLSSKLKTSDRKPLVIHCRTHRRAGWAAHLLAEHGIPSLVLKDGVWGWNFDPLVKSYPSFEEWDPAPEGKAGTEEPDWEAGRKEIEELGL